MQPASDTDPPVSSPRRWWLVLLPVLAVAGLVLGAWPNDDGAVGTPPSTATPSAPGTSTPGTSTLEPAPADSPTPGDTLPAVPVEWNTVDPLADLADIHASSRLRYDECQQDFRHTRGESAGNRLPFYFC